MDQTAPPSPQPLAAIPNTGAPAPHLADPDERLLRWPADEWPRRKRELDTLLASLDER